MFLALVIPQESQLVQHIRDEEDMEHDAVVWDAAPLQQTPGILPPSDLTELTGNEEDSLIDVLEVGTHVVILVI